MGLTAQAILDRADSTVGLFLATIAASAVGEASGNSGSRHSRDGSGTGEPMVIRTVGPMMATAVCVYAPVVASLAFAYEEVSPWSALSVLGASPCGPTTLQPLPGEGALYEEQVGLSEGLKVANRRLSEANLSFATALVQTLEESDRYTAGHSRAVATYSRDIATALGLPLEEQERTYVAASSTTSERSDSRHRCSTRRDVSLSTSAARWNDIRRSASGSCQRSKRTLTSR